MLTWADSKRAAADAPSPFPDLTSWECADSSFHIEDLVAVDVTTVGGGPQISDDDQQTYLAGRV